MRLAAVTGSAPLFCCLLLAGCDGDNTLGPPAEAPSEPLTFHFRMIGDATGFQDFRAITDDPQVIAVARAQLLQPPEARQLFINGPIARGGAGHNLHWNWHFVPGEWELVEVSIELCDGNAVLVSQAVDYWVDVVGRFCPWGSYVAGEVGP